MKNAKKMIIPKFMNGEWCNCEQQTDDVVFFDNNEHPIVRKHHYRCPNCGKVVQVG